jgi:hypothetical protein
MVSLTNTIAAQTFTTSGQCLNWFATQTDKMIFNIDYPTIVTNGLVLNLDAGFTPSYPTTATTWYDVSLGGNNGTLTNGPTFNSGNGGSIVFDGVDDYVSVTKQTALVNASQFTLMASMKRRTSSSKMICYQGADAQNDVSFELWNDGAAYFEVGNNTNSYATIGNTSTDWQYLTMVFDGTQTGNSNRLKCYINGSLLSVSYNGTIPSTSGPSNSVFSIGNSQGIGGNYSDGNISQVLIYNRALSTTEVLQNYYAMLNTRIIVTDSLVLNLQAGNLNSYPGSGSVWNDVSGYGSNMTLLNGPTFNSANGGYITFDNTDDFGFINVTSGNLLGNVNISMELWIKNPVGNFLMNGIYGSYFSSGFYSGGLLKNSGGSAGPSWSSTASWQQWVAVWDQTLNQTRLYVNGTLTGVSSNTSWSPETGGKLVFGGGANGNGTYSKEGSMDISIYRFYNKVLTQSEITQNYNANKTQFGL